MYFIDIEIGPFEIVGPYYGNLWQCWYPSRPVAETSEWQPGMKEDKHPCETPATSPPLDFPIQTSSLALTETVPAV